jgi:ABC-type Fe3+ transport system permease subunit
LEFSYCGGGSGDSRRRHHHGRNLADNMATFPLIFPGLVLGVAVLQLLLQIPLPLYGTLWVLIWAFTINYLLYGLRYAYSGMLQLHSELEEAGGVSGAPTITVLRLIIALWREPGTQFLNEEFSNFKTFRTPAGRMIGAYVRP